ncbi:Aste57867_12599 [Aphanomyces stellatus]|uniref:carbonic anhydrase n=1 Tax=Aphanomyces stellatus TaxID=120398 RepID=A0A485KY05_9STRA|nr:hypothetical protein As57867_012553 [Aphanomyces stellatus]VFT89450.1 Aste57867_12599 [Aphanomyces stellatus]
MHHLALVILSFLCVTLLAATQPSGQRQSPIDLRPHAPVANQGQISIKLGTGPATLVHKGKTIQADWRGSAHSQLVLNGHVYKPLQLHFHAGSEHRFNGIQHALEMHIVHQSVTDKTQLAVLGFAFELSSRTNPFLDQFFPALATNALASHGAQVPVDAIAGKALGVLHGAQFYRYQGSLTTTPFSENVEWVVAAATQPISQAQLNAYLALCPKPTARDVQPLHGRTVTLVQLD